MAVFFTTLFSALGGSAGAAGTAATAGAAASTGFSATSLLSAGATIVGGLASIAAGRQQASALQAQAGQEEIKATQDELEGRQTAVNAIRKMNEEMSAGLVGTFASGLGSSGSAIVAQEEAQRIGERNASLARDQAEQSAAARRQSASQLRQDAKNARTSGILGAVTGGLQYGLRGYNRG